MPLIRYRIGDLVRRLSDDHGLSWELHGRVRDSLTDGEGRRVTTRQVDDCLASVDGILHYQCVQERPGKFSLRYIPDNQGPQAQPMAAAMDRVKKLLGPNASIRVRPASMLLGEPSGKFRLTRKTGE